MCKLTFIEGASIFDRACTECFATEREAMSCSRAGEGTLCHIGTFRQLVQDPHQKQTERPENLSSRQTESSMV